MGWVSLHVRTCRPRFCISGTAWPIEFNFDVWVGGHELGAYHKSWVGYLCTCARAHRTSVSQKRLDRLCSNLVCGLGVTKYVLSTSQGWVGHLCTCARALPSPCLRIRVANCAKIWCVAGDPIVTRFTRVGGGVTAHSHVRLLFSLSRKPLSPDIEATPKTNLPISFALARSSPNMASYWFICWYSHLLFSFAGRYFIPNASQLSRSSECCCNRVVQWRIPRPWEKNQRVAQTCLVFAHFKLLSMPLAGVAKWVWRDPL